MKLSELRKLLEAKRVEIFDRITVSERFTIEQVRKESNMTCSIKGWSDYYNKVEMVLENKDIAELATTGSTCNKDDRLRII